VKKIIWWIARRKFVRMAAAGQIFDRLLSAEKWMGHCIGDPIDPIEQAAYIRYQEKLKELIALMLKCSQPT
jgi:hypothetical protein